mgnify:CR=1 FL=1
MHMFGRRKMNEADASILFVQSILKAGRDTWPGLVRNVQSLLEHDTAKINQDLAAFEFSIACLACQAEAIPNLFPGQQGARILWHTLDTIRNLPFGGVAIEAFGNYKTTWSRALEQGEIPSDAVANLLCERIGLVAAVDILGIRFRDPLLIELIGEAVVTTPAGWWKQHSS